MTLEQRILKVADGPNWLDSRELRAIALEVRKREDRIKRLEEAGDKIAYWFEAREQRHFDALESWRKAKEDKL